MVPLVNRKSMKKVLQAEGIGFEPVYMEIEKARKTGKKSKVKVKKKFIGWRFPQSYPVADPTKNDKEDGEKEDGEVIDTTKNKDQKRKREKQSGPALTYGPTDVPGYLADLFITSRCIKSFED